MSDPTHKYIALEWIDPSSEFLARLRDEPIVHGYIYYAENYRK